MSYQPQPGTIPYRVITFLRLQATGKEYTSAQLSEELDILGPTISSSMDYPKKAGAVLCRKGEDGLLHWSLGNGVAQPLPADYEPDVPLEQLPPIKRRTERQKVDALMPIPVFIQTEPAGDRIPQPEPQPAPAARQSGGIDVEVIERLRSAALSHGEVADLLDMLAECFCFFAHGDSSFKGNDYDRSYMETVLLAAQFAAYDRGEVAKEGV